MSYGTCENFSTVMPNPAAEAEASALNPVDASTSDGAPLPANEPTDLAHYRILRLLGQGGMGKVYQAEDVKLQRVVALKVMLPDMKASLACRERFLREARTMAAVRNDHVVTIYEVGQADDVPYLAMEFLQGQTLDSWFKAAGIPALGDIVRIGREIAEGLAAAQTRGLIHRDIKPANLWLEAPSGRVKILDFGLARPVQNAGLTALGDVVGTPSYMSPEQARGDEVDGRSDLFSLGVVFYQLCTGQLPFKGKSVTAVLTALALHQPTALRELNPNVPPALADLVMQLLEKDVSKRPQSAAVVIDHLRAFEGQLPGSASGILGRATVPAAANTSTLGPDAFSNTLADTPRGPATPRRRRGTWLWAACIITGVLCTGGLGWMCLASMADKENGSVVPTGPAAAPLRWESFTRALARWPSASGRPSTGFCWLSPRSMKRAAYWISLWSW